MNDKELSKEINKTLFIKTSHINPKCNLIKNNFIDNCIHTKNTQITLEYINKNNDCIKLYNLYYDCYKNAERDKRINYEISKYKR